MVAYRNYFVRGEVKKPGGYPYQPYMTVQNAIAVAGGFTERASRKKFEVIRKHNNQRERVLLALSSPVYPDDIINIRESFF